MVFLQIKEYHSLFDFLFNADFTKIRSLSVIFVSYKCENGEMFMDTRLLISREKRKENQKLTSIFNF